MYNVAQGPLLDECTAVLDEFVKAHPDVSAAILTAACRTMTTIPTLTRVAETCIETSVSSTPVPDWRMLSTALEVPEVYENEFYDHCIRMGCILALHVSLKQRMLRAQSTTDEQRILQWLSSWLPSLPIVRGAEHKMLLLWTEMLALLLNQLVFAPSPHAVDQMHTFGQTLLKYAEDKRGEGLLSVLGMGEKSPFPVEFRLAARALGTFVECQFHEHLGFRMKTDVPLQLSRTAEKAMHALHGLQKNKEYAHLISAVSALHQFCSNPSHCMTHVLQLCASVCSLLYPSIRWLRR